MMSDGYQHYKHIILCLLCSSRRRHTRCYRDWSSDVCSSDLSNPAQAFVAEQFKHLCEKDIKILLVSGHHDTPRSIEQGVSPLTVHAKSGHVIFFHDQTPSSTKLDTSQTTVNVTGLSLNPTLTSDQ